MILPAVVVAIGVLGAVSTTAMANDSKALVARWGYSHVENEEQPCQRQIMCKTEAGPLCTYSGQQLYDLITPVSCPDVLFKP